MSVYVFTGPTLSCEDAQRELNATYLPPVSQGDVYRIAKKSPEAIGIIDGYFDQVPAVWHKEILWAMAQGIRVYGSASMGALRAAELRVFGMEGVGEIFEAYAAGLLEDDDEVTVTHGPAEAGYRSLSVAMVNIRKTLDQATAENVLSQTTRKKLELIAKNLFYADRSYAEILRLGAAENLDNDQLQQFKSWLPFGRIDQKRIDAVAMLCKIKQDLETFPKVRSLGFRFEYTVFWDDLTLSAGAVEEASNQSVSMLTADSILEEVRLRGAAYLNARERGQIWDLAMRDFQRGNYRIDVQDLSTKVLERRKSLGLIELKDFEHWLNKNQLTSKEFDNLIRAEIVLNRVLTTCDPGRKRALDYLRLIGDYEKLASRASEKLNCLGAVTQQIPTFEGLKISREELLSWFYKREGPFFAPEPRNFARSLNFPNLEAFLLALLREYQFVKLKEGPIE